MIAHALTSAQESDVFDVVHISTDSKKIADVAGENNASVDFMRPAELADDHTSLMEVLKFTVEEYERKNTFFDTVALIYATSPLIDAQDLKSACEQFEETQKDRALLAVTPFPAPIEKAFQFENNDDLTPANAESFAKRSQDLSQSYYDAGMFCFYTSDYIKNSSGAGNYNSFRGYVVPAYRVTDIDYPEDWDQAEMMYKALNNGN